MNVSKILGLPLSERVKLMYRVLDSFNTDLDNFHKLNLQLVELNRIRDQLNSVTGKNKYGQITSLFAEKVH